MCTTTRWTPWASGSARAVTIGRLSPEAHPLRRRTQAICRIQRMPPIIRPQGRLFNRRASLLRALAGRAVPGTGTVLARDGCTMSGPHAFQVNAPHVIFENIEGELVLIHMAKGSYYSTDAIGAQLWDLIVTGHRLDEMREWADASYQ